MSLSDSQLSSLLSESLSIVSPVSTFKSTKTRMTSLGTYVSSHRTVQSEFQPCYMDHPDTLNAWQCRSVYQRSLHRQYVGLNSIHMVATRRGLRICCHLHTSVKRCFYVNHVNTFLMFATIQKANFLISGVILLNNSNSANVFTKVGFFTTIFQKSYSPS